MDKFRAMEVFVAIADQGSLTAAASHLGSSLPAVVRALAGYEARLGVRLFNRTTRRVCLTDEGREHLAQCRDLLDRVAASEAALSRGVAEPVGQLTITAPVLFGQMYVAPSLIRFVQRHPRLRCNLVLLDRVVNLVEEGMDTGIRIGWLEDSSLVARPLGHIRRVVVATPAWLRRHGTPRHPKDLLQANCIRMTGGPPTWGDFQENGRTFRMPVTGNLEFNHVLPAVQACAAGAGIGMFFSYQVAPYLESRQLKVVLERFERPARPITIVYPHARLLPARTRAFIDWVRADITAFGTAEPGKDLS